MSTQTPTKERGWVAYAHEVRAILDDRQSQFRRPVKPQPVKGKAVDCTVCGMQKKPVGRDVAAACAADYCSYECSGYLQEPYSGSLWPGESQGDFGSPPGWEGLPPFGMPGDRLWVRETWRFLGTDMMRLGQTHHQQDGVFQYQADDQKRTITRHWQDIEKYMVTKQGDKWRPSTHMPRWVSRINLEVTGVRVERVQDISEEDARAEGIERAFTQKQCETLVSLAGRKPEEFGWNNYLWHGNHDAPKNLRRSWPHQYSSYKDARGSFSSLWQLINAKRGFGWETNPFIWAVSFKRVT